MKSFLLLTFSFRNYLRNINRYIVLLFSIALVVFLFFTSNSLSNGVRQSITDKARRYLSGDIVLQAFQLKDDSRLEIIEPTIIETNFSSIENNIDIITKRSVYLRQSQLFFNGQYILQRRINGVSWSEEQKLLENFTFSSGNLPEPNNTEAILISTIVAKFLNVSVGDQVILSARVSGEQVNTRSFIVHGIFNESSFFGYASYVHKDSLNIFSNRSVNYINEIGILFKNNIPNFIKNISQTKLWNTLNQNFDIAPILESRIDRLDLLNSKPEDREVLTLITLDAQLSELNEFLVAIQLITIIILLILSALIFIGVRNTFSLLMIERKKEIAIMRSLGAQKADVVNIFLMEGLLLTFNGTLVGILLSIFTLFQFDSIFSNTNIPFLSLILTNNILPWRISLQNIFLSIIIVTIASLTGILKVVLRTSREFPIQAINK